MPSNKGKEKATSTRLEDDSAAGAKHGIALFVKNLPHNITNEQLSETFSEYAPVRHAFVVTGDEGDQHSNRGIGFVFFAMKEDAEEVMSRFGGKGKGSERVGVQGRKLVLEWAKSKPKDGKDDASVEAFTTQDFIPLESPKRRERRPKPERTTAEQSTTKKQGKDVPKKSSSDKPKSAPAEAVIDKSSRLILRNLPHGITQADLQSLFSKHGSVHEVTIPAPKGKMSPRFAFVWMKTKPEAEKAIKAVNGTTVHAGLALKEEDGGAASSSSGPQGRAVTVDYALPKATYEAGKQAKEPKVKDEADGGPPKLGKHTIFGRSDKDEQDKDEELEDDGSEDESDDDVEMKSEEDEDEEEDEEEDYDRPRKSQGQPPEEGSTVFIRNIPFEVTEEDLGELFRAFGPLRYARITVDEESGRSRGTGFVQFWKKAVADAAIEESIKIKAESGGSLSKGKNATQLFSILRPDPSSHLASKLVLMGRTLDVTRAVSRDEAGNLKKTAEKIKEKKQDGRNIYLLREGVIFEDSSAARHLPPAAVKARIAAYDQRRDLLRTNPALYVSQTRLSVRNLPRFVTDRVLKRLALHSLKAFKEEVAKGTREDVSKDEREVDQELVEKHGKPPKNTIVKQSKIGRHRTQVDPLHPRGEGRSEGFGFLEMTSHTDALRVLRYANNRPGIPALMWSWWKEELTEWIARAKDPTAKEKEQELLETWQRELKEMEEEGFNGKDRPLLVEFSIENKVVTKKRASRLDQQTHPAKPAIHSASKTLGVKRKRITGDEGDSEDDTRAATQHKKGKPAGPRRGRPMGRPHGDSKKPRQGRARH